MDNGQEPASSYDGTPENSARPVEVAVVPQNSPPREEAARHVCTVNADQEEKPKVKPVRFNFELRETTPVNSESDTDDLDPEQDGLADPTIGREPEEVKVWEEDDAGNLVENRRKTYVLTPV